MALNVGIVGLPNVGKSTIFQAITSAPAEAANYPFCTIEPNVGIVQVPDERIGKITEYIKPQKVIPAVMEFVDIAGLVAGASKGEGLGNQFLGHIRQVSAIAHVVRCFEDSDVVHVAGKVDPLSDIEVINIELAFADLETVEKRISNLAKLMKSHDKKQKDKAAIAAPVLDRLKAALEQGKPARSVEMDEEEREAIKDLHLITIKDMLYVCNVDEDSIGEDNELVKAVKELAAKEGSKVIKICGKIESEISQLETPEEKKEFLSDMGLKESGLDVLVKAGYELLGLQTYFTAGVQEVRAWTFEKGMKAPECAGIIHTDFEKGFIKAEVYHCSDLFELHSEAKLKEAGKFRIEGKEYLPKDGDVMHFRFNV
ncbi:MAG: redox-regulated ATPase YchF [Halobacteriovoraceae bacterium]|nr:redox-regulated ATPase YchF [Halobacteriovoraceae bacterium]|tara:strand:- start:26192 stop:27301 length:1110 start_codon:yes stop_codon:yes gene_type:complete